MSASGVWETVHVLYASTDKATGAVTAHIGDVQSGEGTDDGATIMQHWGFLSLPSSPEAGVAGAEAITLKGSGPDIVVAGRDVRSAYIAGLIKMGETCVYASGSQACTLYKLDGAVVNFATHDNTKDGRSIIHTTDTTGVHESTPWGKYDGDATGFHFNHVSGATLDFGTISGLPAPLNVYKSYWSAAANMMSLRGTIISLGPEAGAPDPAAKSTPLVAALSSVAQALTKAASAMTALAVPAGYVTASSGPAAPTANLVSALGQAATSLSAAAAAIAAATPVIPSTSVTVT